VRFGATNVRWAENVSATRAGLMNPGSFEASAMLVLMRSIESIRPYPDNPRDNDAAAEAEHREFASSRSQLRNACPSYSSPCRCVRSRRRPMARRIRELFVEASPGGPVGTRTDWDGQALEITFDPTHGPPPLPPNGPHKIIPGPIFEI